MLFSQSSVSRVLVTFFISEMGVSCIAAFVFESNHVVDDIKWFAPTKMGELMPVDWTRLQVEAAQDYGHGSFITTFLTGSLNYQVTHHIFPHVWLTSYIAFIYS